MLNMKNTILSANVLHRDQKIALAALILAAISVAGYIIHVVRVLITKVKNFEMERKGLDAQVQTIIQRLEALERNQGAVVQRNQDAVP